ncbi:basic proline-rich protein-like [Melozone crissalis]|uniref:basic proline-rich protein-like n=1 Tax=Melozone crissalis TaxID=40204 RepID=UPI0023DCCC60|nr:basic proline-rich protein-like [Melozone crissalis]
MPLPRVTGNGRSASSAATGSPRGSIPSGRSPPSPAGTKRSRRCSCRRAGPPALRVGRGPRSPRSRSSPPPAGPSAPPPPVPAAPPPAEGRGPALQASRRCPQGDGAPPGRSPSPGPSPPPPGSPAAAPARYLRRARPVGPAFKPAPPALTGTASRARCAPASRARHGPRGERRAPPRGGERLPGGGGSCCVAMEMPRPLRQRARLPLAEPLAPPTPGVPRA